MDDDIIPFGAGVIAPDTAPAPSRASERIGPEYEDCTRCLERFFGSDAGVWLNGDGVCRGCLTARSLKCPDCDHKVGSWHSTSCATIKGRGQLTEVFVTDCDFPY